MLRKALLVGVSALATVSFSASAFAQDTDAQDSPDPTETVAADDEAIVITGVRASLERAMDIKRESTGVVDAISAEDIGKFPDTNLAESLQRIPGVSISRVNGEGSEVTVRGFGAQFNLVTLNGRQMPTANVAVVGGDQSVDFNRATGRSFDFGNLASEGVSRLEVYKTGRAAIPSGGIGATINVVTQRPLDGPADGLRGSIGAKAAHDVAAEGFKVTPELSGLVSWSDVNDTIGVSLFGSYQKRESAAASATVNGWNITGVYTGTAANDPFAVPNGSFINDQTQVNNLPAEDILIGVPNDMRYHWSETERERINGQATVQFRPMESLTLTADAFYAQNKTSEQRMDQTHWFNRPFQQVTIDDHPEVATTIFVHNDFAGGGRDVGFEQQYRATKDTIKSFGANAQWQITDAMTLNIDGHTSVSKSSPDSDNGATSTLFSMGAPVLTSHNVDYSGRFPVSTYTMDDSQRGNNNGVLDVGDLGTQIARTNEDNQKHRVKQLRADLGWEFGDGGRFDIGGTYVESRMTSRRIQRTQTLGNWSIENPGDVAANAAGLVETFCLACKFDKFEPGMAPIAFWANAVDLWAAVGPAYDGIPGRELAVNNDQFDQVDEEIWGGYAQLTLKGDLMGVPAGLVAGVRYERTNVKSASEIAVPQSIVWLSNNDFNITVSDERLPVTQSSNYERVLPAIDFQLEPMEDLVTRMSYSHTIARPDYGDLFVSDDPDTPGRPTALGGSAGGTAGNVNLVPLLSKNIDLSIEYYFAPSSYVSVGFFHKKVKNFIGTGVVERELFGLRDPSSGAPGSRSGIALDRLQALGAEVNETNLFAMTALYIQTGDIDAAADQFMANYDPVSGQIDTTFSGNLEIAVDVVPDGNDPLFMFDVSQPLNTEDANIHGFEIQGQYFFGQTGFGVQAGYTRVLGDVSVDIASDPSVDQFALLGLSDSFNVTGIYENYGFSARVTYNWRDKYLAEVNRGGNDRNPVFVEPFGTLDLNLSYDLTENIALSLEALNVLSEPIRTHGRTKNQVWFVQELKPRILAGVRFRF